LQLKKNDFTLCRKFRSKLLGIDTEKQLLDKWNAFETK